jgi:gas vesicle protein
MNSFVKGVLVGVGIGLVIAPMKGEEMRRMLSERFQEFRGYLPENEQMNQYVQQVSDRVSQTSEDLKVYAQQAASKVKDTGTTLGGLAQQAATSVKQTGQDVAGTAQQAATSVKQTGQDVANTTKQAATSAKQNATASTQQGADNYGGGYKA